MTYDQTLRIAEHLGRLKGQNEVDEKTRLRCAYEVLDAILFNSTALDSDGHLREWRKRAGILDTDPYVIQVT